MRKRYRMPKTFYKRGLSFCFKVTTTYGKRIEIKSATMEEARRRRNEIEKQIFSAVNDSPNYKVTFEQGIDFWLRHKEGSIDKASYERFKIYMTNIMAFINSKYPSFKYWDEIKPEHVKEYMLYRQNEQGRAPKTINSEKQALGNLFKTLFEYEKILGYNPVDKVNNLKKDPVRVGRCIPDEELNKFFDCIKAENENISWCAIFATLLMTGMRRDEVRLRQIKDIDFEKGIIKVTQTKTDKPKMVFIHPKLEPFLRVAVERAKKLNSKWLFPNTEGDMLVKNKIRDKMIEICKKAGIPKATVHDLRHTFASKQDLSDKTKQEIGGWSSKEVMEKTYNHPPAEIIRNDYFKADFPLGNNS